MVEKSGFLNTLTLLNDFVTQVVVVRRDSGLHRGASGLLETLSCRPHAWLRPDFVSPPLFLFLKDGVAKTSDLADLGGAPSY